MRELKPRFTIGTITTNDEKQAQVMLDTYKKHKLTHAEIYQIGIDYLLGLTEVKP